MGSAIIQDKIRLIIAKCCQEYHANFEEGSVSDILDETLSAITKIIEEEKDKMTNTTSLPLSKALFEKGLKKKYNAKYRAKYPWKKHYDWAQALTAKIIRQGI